MKAENKLVSKAFEELMNEAPQLAAAWNSRVHDFSKANTLDSKATSLAYLAVLATFGSEGGIPLHEETAKKVGVSRDEVISAILMRLPAAGYGVT